MDTSLRRDILQWDVFNWAKPLAYWEKMLGKETKKLICLELGSREGGLSLWLAKKGHHVITSDIFSAERNASPLHEKHNVKNNIEYKDLDATNIPYENHFDIIIFKSIIGGIGYGDNREAQRKAFHEIHKALKPGGKLLFAENMKATSLHSFFRKKFTNWGANWRYLSLGDFKNFLKPFSKVEIKTTGFLGVFGKNEAMKQSLGVVDKVLFNNITPRSWRYIAYGMAIK